MTRETKLALLIALGVILLVGVVLTDLHSDAQDRQPPRMTDFGGQVHQTLRPPPVIETDRFTQRAARQQPAQDRQPTKSAPPVPAPEKIQPQMVRRVDSIQAPLRPAPALIVPLEPDPSAVEPPQPVPSIRRSRSTTVRRPVFHPVGEGEGLWAIADHYYGDGSRWPLLKRGNPDLVAADNTVQTGVLLRIPNLDETDQEPTAEPTPTPASSPRRSMPQATDATRIRVAAGDSFSSLAERHLGSSSRWRQLYDANAARLDLESPTDLRSGMALALPAPAPANATARRRNSTSAARSHRVARGETLSLLAGKYLGDKRQWRRIYDANRRSIRNPDALEIGLTLNIPERHAALARSR